MFNHAPSYASKWTSGLILFLGICEISCKCVNDGGPAPVPKPKPAEIDPETTLKQFVPPLQPHKLTPPPLPSGSFDSYDSDQHKYNLTSSGEERNKYGVNPYGVQKSGEFKLGIQYWADDEVMLRFPRYPPLRSFEKHYGRYGGLNARRFWAHWDIPDDRSANGFHSGFNSDNVMGGRPPPLNSHDFEYKPNRYPKRYYMRSHENPKAKKRVQRAVANVRNEVNEEDFGYDLNMVNPYNMGGRPPPGKTERRKRKTQEMANTFAIRNKRGVTPQMNSDVKEKIQRMRRELDSEGHEGNMLSKLFHPRIPLKKDTLQRTLASHEGGFQTDVHYNDYPILESLVEFDDSKVRKMYANESSGEYVESDEGERDYLLDPKMTTRDDPLREFVFFSKVKKGYTTTIVSSVENDTSCFSFNPNSSAIEESVDTVGYPPLDCTTNILQKMLIEDEPHHYDSDYHFVTETLDKLKKRNKKDTRGNKRHAFRSWMSKIVPEHAAHIEKLHDKGIDKLMEQKVHGKKKTYGELFHEQHENKENEARHLDIHDEHHLKMHGEHEPLHEEHDLHHEGEPHHFEMKDGHHQLHEGLDPHHFEMHEGHEPHQLEEHEGHGPDHLEIHAKEHDSHHLDKEKLNEEHKLKARKKLLEEMYLKEGKKSHEVKDKHELEETEHDESQQAQTAAAPVQQAQQQQYQQQLYQQQQQQQNQMYNQQNGQYNNYNNYGGGGGGGMGGMGMNGMGGMGGMGMNGMGGMGGMGMNGMGGMGMNGMGGMGMNGMGMGQMGGFGAILNAVNNNLPKLSQQPAQAQQAQGGNYPQNTQQNYGGQNPSYGAQNYPQSPAANGQDPNIQAAQDAAAAQQKAAQDQEAQLQQPDPQDSTAIQDNKDQDTSQDSSINAKAGDASDDDIKADNSNGNDDLNLPSADTINAQQDNAPVDEQNPQLDNLQQNPQFDNAQLGHYDTGVNSANMAAAAAG